MTTLKCFLSTGLPVLLFIAGCDRFGGDPHAGHDHGEAEALAVHVEDAQDEAATGEVHSEDDGDDHAGEAAPIAVHIEDDGHDHADDAGHTEVTPDQREDIGLRLATAGPGEVGVTAAFPGEVILNPDRRAHIVPRAAGIVRAADKALGEYVEAGEILAWVESDELAEAKLAFYDKQTEVGCCQIELPRAKEIFENVTRLLIALETEPGADELAKLDGREMGEYRGRIITAHAAYLATKRTHERERELHARNISSEQELIAAEAAFKKAQAEFVAARDTARYQVLIDYTEAAQKQQVAEFEAVAAEQRLRLKGVGEEDVAKLLALVPKTSGLEPCLCDDPNCSEDELPSVTDTLGSEERLGWYALRAPFRGYITEKHLTLGEKVGDEESVMTIADTSSVWVRFNVYQKDLAIVKAGQKVHIDVGGEGPEVTGEIAYVAPIVDPATRTAFARVELDNADGALRPGLYATVHVNVKPVDAPIVVNRDAVQTLDDEAVVFVPEGDEFIAVPVRLGRADHEHIAVLAGLEPGQRYVAHGAFELKAGIVTSGADPHAGHGH